MAEILHEKVHPLVVVMVHRLVETFPCVLFVKQHAESNWTLMHDYMRVREQPYSAGLRVINNTLDLNIRNVRLRCYFCNTIYGGREEDDTLAAYYTLKLRDTETTLLDKMLENNLDSMRISGFKWVSVYEENLDSINGEQFDSKMSYCWETMRKAIASNYGVRISK